MSFSPPPGIAFHIADEIPVVELCVSLRRVARFLQSLEFSPSRLCLYHDWWQHDGLHFGKHFVTFHDLFAMIETPRAIFEATPDDHAVFVGIAPENSCWYLRFRAEWDADDTSIVGAFAVIVPSESAAAFRTEIASLSDCRLGEEPADSYYQRVTA